MNYLIQQEDYIYEKMYDEYKTPFHNRNKYDRWCINANDKDDDLSSLEWCVSFFDKDLKKDNKVYHIQKWGEPFDVEIDITSGNIISYKGNCDIDNIIIFNNKWRNCNKNSYNKKYNDILDKLWNFHRNMIMD